MSRRKAENGEAATEETPAAAYTSGGVAIEGEVITGVDNKLSAKEQGQKARGELDENGQPIGAGTKKLAEADKLELTGGAEAGNDARTDKEKATDIKIEERIKYLEAAGDTSTLGKRAKVDEPLYQGHITASAIASVTGQEVSVVFEQTFPTTEDGLFNAFRGYHPSARRDSFKVDPKNETDPTLRTYYEK